MATIAAINQVGESIAAMLRARRDLLASAGQLAPVPAAIEISQMSVAKFVTGSPPTTGLTITCYQIAHSDHPKSHVKIPGEPERAEIAVELQYLLASWAAKPEDEQATIAWAMLELSAHSMFDRSLLRGTNIWEPDETVQVVPNSLSPDEIYRLWDALGQKMRLSMALTARVVRLRRSLGEDQGVVVASRLGFSDTDPLVRQSA